jgi:pyrimidine operon attenuation protein / uracil phosphoribosyltransferase
VKTHLALEGPDIARAIVRISHEILENNKGSENLLILGIPSGGVPLANRIAKKISEIENREIKCGVLDTTLYRDDVRLRPARTPQETQIPDNKVDSMIVVLVDDVLFSGRTIRAALDALTALGRPKKVQLAVLIDRGHRELPIRPDYVGKNLPTSQDQSIKVRLTEIDGIDQVEVTA